MFSKRYLESLQPTGKIYSVKDEKTPGLILMVTPKGAKTFYSYRWLAGRPERIKIGTFPAFTVDQARAKANEINGAIARDGNPASVKRAIRAEPSFREVFDRFIKEKRNRSGRPLAPRTIVEYEALVQIHLKGIESLKMSQVTPDRLRGIKIASDAQTNKARAVISTVFNWAISEGIMAVHNPASAIKSRFIKSRERFLQPAEFPRFMAAVEASRYRDFFLLALYTGARTSNLIAMRWQDIDLTEAVWVIPKTKNGDLQRVALSPETVEILKHRKAHKVVNAVWVFPSHGKTGHIVAPRKAWADLFDWDELEQLKKSIMAIGWPVPESEGDIRSLASKHKIKVDRLDHLRIHDLRRTLGSWQARQGASLTIIGKSLGHKSQQATQIYSRLDLDPVRQSVEQATASMRKASVANDE